MFNMVMSIGIPVIIFIMIAIFCATRYVLVKDPSKVLVIKRLNGQIVTAKTGGFVWPFINSYTIVSLTKRMITVVSGELKEMKYEHLEHSKEYTAYLRIGEGSYCKNDIRVDIAVAFQLSIPFEKLPEIAGQFDPKLLENAKELAHYFEPKFAEALKSATRQHDYLDLMNDRAAYRESVRNAIAKELHGFVLADVLISEIRQTDVSKLNNSDILDVQGRQIIESITTERNNNIKRIKETGLTQFTEEEVKGQQARLQLHMGLEKEKFQTDRQIKVAKIEEETLVINKNSEETLAREEIRLKTFQQQRILEENAEREIQTASINNQQALGIKEQEKSREIKLAEINANNEADKQIVDNKVLISTKHLELHSTEAKVVSIKKDIAKEEEQTNDIRVLSAAERKKNEQITLAEGTAMAQKRTEIIASETSKEQSLLRSEEKRIDAETALVVVEKEVEGRRKVVELTQDEFAAEGIGRAKASIAEADAIEKLGAVKAANITLEGEAEANSKKAIYAAMRELPDDTRKHEIRLKEMDNELVLQTKTIDAEKEIGIADANARAKAFENSDISIIGDADTLAKVTESRSGSVAFNEKIRSSKLLKTVAQPYIDGEKDLPEDAAKILKEITVNGGEILNLTIAQALAHPEFGSKITSLLFGKK